MKRIKLISMLLALMMVFGSLIGTSALAATTTAETTAVVAQTEESEEATTENGIGKQIVKILIFGAIVGVIAAIYGLTTMRYNQEKLDDMTEETRKLMKRMQDKDE